MGALIVIALIVKFWPIILFLGIPLVGLFLWIIFSPSENNSTCNRSHKVKLSDRYFYHPETDSYSPFSDTGKDYTQTIHPESLKEEDPELFEELYGDGWD